MFPCQLPGLLQLLLEGNGNPLDAPVQVDEGQRVGVVPVGDAYRPERTLPLPAVPGELTRALDAAGLFDASTEVSADWPADGDIPGLRELAARYRSGYLLRQFPKAWPAFGLAAAAWMKDDSIGTRQM